MGEEQVKLWRRSSDVPPLRSNWTTRATRAMIQVCDFHPEDLPATECLKDTIERLCRTRRRTSGLQYDRETGASRSHGNTLRGMIKYIERISDKDIAD